MREWYNNFMENQSNSSNKSLGIIITLVLVVGIGWFVYHKKQQSIAPPVVTPTTTYQTPTTQNPAPTPTPVATSTPSGITMAQVATHNSKASCWSAIGGFVYDLTSWIPYHPGGEQAILSLCGIDGTTKFNGKHGNDSRAKGVLAGFKIGILAQ